METATDVLTAEISKVTAKPCMTPLSTIAMVVTCTRLTTAISRVKDTICHYCIAYKDVSRITLYPNKTLSLTRDQKHPPAH